MLTEFLMVIPQTPSLVLVTYRPEYHGALTQMAGAQTVALAPLSDSETAALVSELVGPDPSINRLGQTIADRAAGNPSASVGKHDGNNLGQGSIGGSGGSGSD